MAFDELKKLQRGELWNRFLQVRPERIVDEPYSYIRPLPEPVIYHYTGIDGLKGILESNRLWASAAHYLNDSSEIEYGCDLAAGELAHWLETNENVESFAVNVLKSIHRILTHPISRLSRGATIYVACFCQDGNLLSQWRAYGQAGGYSLGFEVDNDWQSMRLGMPGELWDSTLVKVIYVRDDQRRRINSILRQGFEAVRDIVPDERVLVGADVAKLLVDVVQYLSELLLNQIVTFKNPAFREENEWRLVVRPNLIRGQDRKPPSRGPSPKFKFRQSRGSLIPYLELHPTDDKIPLKSVRYGPSLVGNRVEGPLRLLLADCGFTNVEVTGSELPVIL